MRADLHIHTNYSDGGFLVSEIIQMAKEASLDIIAITDHDLFAGAVEAKKYEDDSLRIIIGLELSTEYNEESIHILGYFNQINNSDALDGILRKQREMRLKRAYIIKEELFKHFKIDLKMDDIIGIPSITRGTIAGEIIKQGYPYSKAEIFDKMIGKGCPAYYPSTKMGPEFGIKLIHDHGGLAVLAHPVLVKASPIQEIIDFGLDGIEAIYPANDIDDTAKLKALALKNDIFITGGSDFHLLNDLKHGNIGEYYLEGNELKIFLNKLKEANR